MCHSPVLAMFDPNRDTILSADASSFGLGAVLRQRQDDGTLRPIAYISRAMRAKIRANRKGSTCSNLGL